MKRALWINLGLLALVLVAGWAVFIAPAEKTPSRFPLSALKADVVDTIQIEGAKREAVTLVRRDGTWWVTAPFKSRADVLRVEGLLSLLSAQSEKRFPATDLARFGLDQPQARVTMGGQEFRFGSAHPLSQQIYVETQGSVYLVSPIYFVDVARLPEDYAARTLLDAAEQPVAFAAGAVSLTRSEGKWVAEPAQPEFTQDAANTLADDWRQLRAAAVTRMAGKPLAQLRLTLADGRALAFEILQREPEYAIRRVDEGLVYHFPREQAMRLLGPLKLVQ